MTTAQRKVLGLSIVAAALIIAWLSWAWSPRSPLSAGSPRSTSAETEPAASEADDGAQAVAAPQPPAPLTAAVKSAPPPQPAVPAPSPAAPIAQEPEEPHERIPTPHVMSLDQLRPPEAYGPLAEYKQRYESESRGADSTANEKKYRKYLDVPNIPPGLVQDVSCRRSMCKLAMSWRPERRLGFVVTVESSKHMYNQRVAVEPGEREDDGSYLTNIFIRLTP